MSALPRPAFEILPEPSNWRRWIVDRNPFYLLSAVFMLLGCLLVTNSLSWSPIPEYRLLALVGTLNIYELALVALGLYLIVARSITRDGQMLLLLECFFLVDGAFLNAELFARDLWVGIGMNSALFVLALVKVFAMFKALNLSVLGLRFGVLMVQLAVLFALPGWLKWVSITSPRSMTLALYAGWWAVAFLVAMWAWFERHPQKAETSSPARLIGAVLLVLPVVSIIAHLGTAHWVYNTDFRAAHLAPVVLGLAVWAGAVWRWPTWKARAVAVQFLLPLAAILLCYDHARALHLSVFAMDVTALRLVVVGAFACYLETWALHRRIEFLALVSAGTLGAGISVTPSWVWTGIADAVESAVDWLWSLVPSTRTQWGLMSVVAAFVCLGAGAVVSLWKRPEQGFAVESTKSNEPI